MEQRKKDQLNAIFILLTLAAVGIGMLNLLNLLFFPL